MVRVFSYPPSNFKSNPFDVWIHDILFEYFSSLVKKDRIPHQKLLLCKTSTFDSFSNRCHREDIIHWIKYLFDYFQEEEFLTWWSCGSITEIKSNWFIFLSIISWFNLWIQFLVDNRMIWVIIDVNTLHIP